MTDKNHLLWTFMFWSYLWFHAHMSYIWAQWQNEEKSIGFRTPGFGKRQEPGGRGWGHHPPTREPCPGSGRLGEHSSGFILSSPSTKWMLCSLWLTGWMLLEFSIIFRDLADSIQADSRSEGSDKASTWRRGSSEPAETEVTSLPLHPPNVTAWRNVRQRTMVTAVKS